jgi:glucose-1-phosphate cytidylyltransferase
MEVGAELFVLNCSGIQSNYKFMKVVILAGGLGTRLSEETDIKPKPMVEIGGSPILWHIMKIYSSYGYNEFVICLGYKGYVIKEYFSNYFLHKSNIEIDIANNSVKTLDSTAEKWKISLIDTGKDTMTGGRIKRIKDIIGNEPFMLTYGDGVANIDIAALVEHHKKSGKKATVTAVQPSGRFGGLQIGEDNNVQEFVEKPKGDGSWINGGFFVCEPSVFDYIKDDTTIWEKTPLESLANENELASFKHTDFWRPMDTLKDKKDLNEMWDSNTAVWKTWK